MSQPPLGPALHGAVDLSALRNRPAPGAAPATGTSAPDGTNPFVLDVTEATFEADVLAQSQTVPVVIDFWAEWCGQCRQFTPVYEKSSEEHTDVTFAKVDTEAERALAGKYGITSIPTLVIYRDSIPVFMQPGALPGNVLEDLITQVKGLDMDTVRTQYEEQLKAAGR